MQALRAGTVLVKVEGNIEKLSESCRKGGDYLYLKASCFPPVKSPDCLAKGVKVVAATMSSKENFVYTACPGLGDHENCTLKTYVKDGRIIRTEKLVYPPPEGDHAVICQKGLAAGRLPYLPGRLKKPPQPSSVTVPCAGSSRPGSAGLRS